MNIKKWFFDKILTAKVNGEIELPDNTEPIRVNTNMHHLISEYFHRTANAIMQVEGFSKLFSMPKVHYNKGVHTRATMMEIDGLGVVSIIFNSETGQPLFAEIKEIENEYKAI